MSKTSFPETRAAWARFKASWAGLWHEIKLSRAQRLASKAMFIYLECNMPRTSLTIAQALRTSLDEEPIGKSKKAPS